MSGSSSTTIQFEDNRPQNALQRKLKALASGSVKLIDPSQHLTAHDYSTMVQHPPANQLQAAKAPYPGMMTQLKHTENQWLGNLGTTQLRKLPFDQIREAAYKSLRSWVSPEIAKWSKNQGLKFVVSGVVKGMGKPYDDEDIDAIVSFIDSYEKDIAKITPTEFDAFIEVLGVYGGRKEYVAYLKKIHWPRDKKPSVVFGRAVTTAFYDFNKHVITLDPWKLHTWTDFLDALTFECQNAIQRGILKSASKKGGAETAAAEYESDKMYVSALMDINNAKDLNKLVEILEIPKAYLKPADFAKSLADKRVERPDRTNLPEQDKRQVLWWWKTQSWSDLQRKKVWILENHGEGVASSIEIYSK